MIQDGLKNPGGARDPYLQPYRTNPPEGWRVWNRIPQHWVIFTIFQWITQVQAFLSF